MTVLLLSHITAGGLAILAGFMAVILKKGSHRHRMAGNIFLYSMLIASAAGAWAAWFIPDQFIAVFGGTLAFYLTATGAMAAKGAEGKTGLPEVAALILILVVTAILIILGMQAMNDPTGLKNGYPSGPYFFLATIAALGGFLDIRNLVQGGVKGAQRIARHLWRMLFAFFIAAGSLFTGPGANAFPQVLRESGVLSAPELIIFLLILFWLARVLFTNWFAKEENA